MPHRKEGHGPHHTAWGAFKKKPEKQAVTPPPAAATEEPIDPAVAAYGADPHARMNGYVREYDYLPDPKRWLEPMHFARTVSPTAPHTEKKAPKHRDTKNIGALTASGDFTTDHHLIYTSESGKVIGEVHYLHSAEGKATRVLAELSRSGHMHIHPTVSNGHLHEFAEDSSLTPDKGGVDVELLEPLDKTLARHLATALSEITKHPISAHELAPYDGKNWHFGGISVEALAELSAVQIAIAGRYISRQSRNGTHADGLKQTSGNEAQPTAIATR